MFCLPAHHFFPLYRGCNGGTSAAHKSGNRCNTDLIPAFLRRKYSLQSEFWNDPVTQAVEDNPLHISGIKRTAANLHLFVSPFAQTACQPYILEEPESKEDCSLLLKNMPYHFEFCMINILEMLLFCQIGIHIFKKQDLK